MSFFAFLCKSWYNIISYSLFILVFINKGWPTYKKFFGGIQMKVTTASGSLYELIGSESGLELRSAKFNGIIRNITSIERNKPLKLQYDVNGKLYSLTTSEITSIEGCICFETNPKHTLIIANKNQLFIMFGLRECIVREIKNIKLGEKVTISYNQLNIYNMPTDGASTYQTYSLSKITT